MIKFLCNQFRACRRRLRLRDRMPDSVYLKSIYFEATGQRLNLRNPVTFNDKIQWLKLNYRHRLLIDLVDKFAARQYVSKHAGDRYLTQLHDVYESAHAINFDTLPQRFVLKVTNGSGTNIICPDKNKLDINAARQALSEWMATNKSNDYREWTYAHVPPKIICEEFLEDEPGQEATNYRFFCTQGRSRICQVDQARNNMPLRSLYDMDWQKLPVDMRFKSTSDPLPKPPALDEMMDVAYRLAKDLPFCRVDLYNIGKRIVFGEMTLFPAGGNLLLSPVETGVEWGKWITLPARSRKLKSR